MTSIQFTLPAGADNVFAEDAFQGNIGKPILFDGKPAVVTAAEVIADGQAVLLTIETDEKPTEEEIISEASRRYHTDAEFRAKVERALSVALHRRPFDPRYDLFVVVTNAMSKAISVAFILQEKKII